LPKHLSQRGGRQGEEGATEAEESSKQLMGEGPLRSHQGEEGATEESSKQLMMEVDDKEKTSFLSHFIVLIGSGTQ
jgi:hypothetical protein